MTTTANKGTFQPDSDVHITYEDQQKINRFARLNAKLSDLKEEIKIKENDLQSVEEAAEEISLMDADEQIPYLVGEVFIYQNTETTEKCLEEAKEKILKETTELRKKVTDIRETMGQLKAHLYGKFGGHINLEADEE